MSRSLHPPCVGSAGYGPHSAKVPRAYTVIAPSGTVFYACDSDCLTRHLEWLQVQSGTVSRTSAAASRAAAAAFLRRGGRP